MSETNVEQREGILPPTVRDKAKKAHNVVGAAFLSPYDLDGYLDEPQGKFGLWVGESEEEAELMMFELDGTQIEGLGKAFGLLIGDSVEESELHVFEIDDEQAEGLAEAFGQQADEVRGLREKSDD